MSKRPLPATFLTVLLCSFTSAQAVGPVPVSPAQHPIVGSWRWTLAGKSCEEIYQYRANGTRAGISGEETTLSHYEISPLPSLLGFYRLVETVTNGNGKPDCSGDLHEVSDGPTTRYIQLSPKRDQLIICKDESLHACFGPLKRKPE